MALTPYDEPHTFSAQLLIDFGRYFGGHSADYVRLDVDQAEKLKTVKLFYVSQSQLDQDLAVLEHQALERLNLLLTS